LADTLPGITAAKVTALQGLLDAYRNGNVPESSAQASPASARGTLAEQIESINTRRRQIQFAADAEWPHTNSTNAGIRSEFQLTPNRPFNA
jgi:hypothetical protein